MTKDALELLDGLKKRPRMYLLRDTGSDSTKVFLLGYIQGIGQELSINLHESISRWFQKKVNQRCSLLWCEHITDYYKDKSDGERTLLLIQTLEVFFSENSDILDGKVNR